MDSINENGHSFKFVIIGEHYASSPALLGRDNPYTLNVKLVDKDGKPVSGVKYKITSTNDGAHLVVTDGMDKTYTSSEAGEDFYIEGLPATTEADLKNMQYAFSVDCETEGESETVIGRYPLRMGRLLRWGRPGISVKANPDKAVFSTKTERVAKESTAGARWNWGEKVNQCTLKLGTSIEGSGATSPTNNNDGSFSAAPEIDLSKFSNVSTATLQFEGGLSDDQFTAVLPSTENDVELYYFQSVAFTKPSVIVGVPAEVTCKLMGLDKKPRANVDVEWTTNFGTLNPAGNKTDAQGVAKTACTANEAGTATVTVLSKAQRTIRGTSAAIPVGPLVIVEPVASATQYIVGHSSAIQYAVTLKAGGQPVSGLTVEWFIGDTAKGTSTSDSSGKATRDLTFSAGQAVKQVVKARVSGTQVQTTFDVDVYAVDITDPRASATEYVIKHSADVEFSVVLKAGDKPLSGKTIEWTVGGNKINSTTDSTGKATFKKAFDAAGDVTVSAKDPNSGKTHNFQLKVFAVEITDPKASATEYVIKHSPDVEFSVVLKAGGKPLSGKTIEWTVGGNKTNSTTDSTGKATFKKAFDFAWYATVSAQDPKSRSTRLFFVMVSDVEVTRADPSSIDYLVEVDEDINFSAVFVGGTKALNNIKIEWLVDGEKKGESSTDPSGKAVFSSKFIQENDYSVVARDMKSGVQSRAMRVFAWKCRVSVGWTIQDFDANWNLGSRPGHRFNGFTYQIVVQSVDLVDGRVKSLPFSYSFAGVTRHGVLTGEPTVLDVLVNLNDEAVVPFIVSGDGVRRVEESYKVGWLFSPYKLNKLTKDPSTDMEVRWKLCKTLSSPVVLPWDVMTGVVRLKSNTGGWGGEINTYLVKSEELVGMAREVSGNYFNIAEAELRNGHIVFNGRDLYSD